MPNELNSQTVHIGSRTGNIEAMNESSLPRGGELGAVVKAQENKGYQIVQCDSGATAAAPSGVVIAGDLAFWKDKANYLVTPDVAQAMGAEDATNDNKRNNVAGRFTAAVTAGNYCVIQQKGRGSVRSDGGADFTAGDKAIAANTTASDIDRMAAGTAPTHTVVGTVAAAESGGFTAVDLDLPPAP